MLKFLGDFLALAGLAIVAVPAWYANRFGHRLAKVDLDGVQFGAPEFQTKYDELIKKLKAERDDWKPWKGWCFWIGTATGLVGAAILLGADLTDHAAAPQPQPSAAHAQ